MTDKKRARTMETTTIRQNGREIHTSTFCDDSDDDGDAEAAFESARMIPVPFATVARSVTKLVDSETCWGCVNSFGKARPRGRHKGFDFLNDAWQTHKDNMEDTVMADVISKLHEVHIRAPEVACGNLKALVWSPADVLLHLRTHLNDHKYNLKSTFQRYAIIEHKLSDCLFVRSEDGTLTTLDATAFKQMMELGKLKIALGNAIDKM